MITALPIPAAPESLSLPCCARLAQTVQAGQSLGLTPRGGLAFRADRA